MSELDAVRRQDEALFRAVIEKSAEVISLTFADGTTRYLTSAAWQLLGWTPEEMGSRTLREQVVPEDEVRIASEIERLVRTGARDLAMEFQARHRDGSLRWIEGAWTNLLGDPDVRAIVGNYRDVTARRKAEEALRANRDLFEEAQAIAHIGSWTSGFGPDGEIIWSREGYRIYGVPEGTPFTVSTFMAFVHPDDREHVQKTTRAAIDEGAPADVEHRIVRPDGQVRHLHQRGKVERDANGVPIRMIGTVEDVTDRHAALAALHKSEERYRRIVESTSDGVWMYDAAGITTFMNARLAQMLGITVDEAVGQPIYLFVNDSDRDAAAQRVARRAGGVSERSDFVLRRKDGTTFVASVRANALFDTAGHFEMALALVSDVTEQRRADEARAHLAAIVESSDDAITSVALDNRITSWNRGAERLYQYHADEMIGQPFTTLFPEDVREAEAAVLDRIVLGETVRQYETTRRRKDGTLVEVAVTVSPVRDRAGAVIGIARSARDLTVHRQIEAALQRTEEQFRQAQKMEAIGRLAGGVAHDFNNLLTIIMSYVTLALEDIEHGSPLRRDLGEIEAAGRRATELTSQLLAFSRQQVLQPRVIDLNDIISSIHVMIGRVIGEDIDLTLVKAPSLGRILADPGQMDQVLMNLAVNARDAMPDGGKLTIETRDVTLPEEDGNEHTDVVAGSYVMMAVTDTGVGMTPAVRERIFEPFFTTKDLGKGTGLGLSTVFGIIRQNGGHISVESEPGHGSTFQVYLPHTDRIPDPVPLMEARSGLGGSETLLVVEDEAPVRTVACAILRRSGYDVLECSGGAEAIRVAADFPGEIHLLLTDVVMPVMGGRELAEALSAVRPRMKVLFASGYTDDAIVRHAVLDAAVAFLQKPFTHKELLERVREALSVQGPA